MSSTLLTAPPVKKGIVDWPSEYVFSDLIRDTYWKAQEPPIEGHPDWKASLARKLELASKIAEEAFLFAEVLPKGSEGALDQFKLGVFYRGIVTHGGR